MRWPRFVASRLFPLLVLVSFFTLSANGAGFIKFDGVEGESQASGHEGESDVISWSWSIHDIPAEDGSTRRRGDAIVEDLVVTKVLDKASVKLLEACVQGRVYPKVTLKLEQPGAAGGVFGYFVIEMKNVSVSAFSVGSASGEDRPTESVSMNFEEFKATYNLQNSDGSSGGNVETTWKIEEGEP